MIKPSVKCYLTWLSLQPQNPLIDERCANQLCCVGHPKPRCTSMSASHACTAQGVVLNCSAQMIQISVNQGTGSDPTGRDPISQRPGFELFVHLPNRNMAYAYYVLLCMYFIFVHRGEYFTQQFTPRPVQSVVRLSSHKYIGAVV